MSDMSDAAETPRLEQMRAAVREAISQATRATKAPECAPDDPLHETLAGLEATLALLETVTAPEPNIFEDDDVGDGFDNFWDIPDILGTRDDAQIVQINRAILCEPIWAFKTAAPDGEELVHVRESLEEAEAALQAIRSAAK